MWVWLDPHRGLVGSHVWLEAHCGTPRSSRRTKFTRASRRPHRFRRIGQEGLILHYDFGNMSEPESSTSTARAGGAGPTGSRPTGTGRCSSATTSRPDQALILPSGHTAARRPPRRRSILRRPPRRPWFRRPRARRRVRVGDARTEGVADPARGHARHDVVAGTYRFVAKCRRAGIGQHETRLRRAPSVRARSNACPPRKSCPTRRRTPGRPRSGESSGVTSGARPAASPVEGSRSPDTRQEPSRGVPASSNVSHNAAPNSEARRAPSRARPRR